MFKGSNFGLDVGLGCGLYMLLLRSVLSLTQRPVDRPNGEIPPIFCCSVGASCILGAVLSTC